MKTSQIKKNKTLVSVIIGIKNSEEYIEKCLTAIKNQTYQNVETIVVDNFSTDKTPEIAKKYADVFIQCGPERSAQRNRGIQESSGKYVLVLDADQYLTPGVVEEAVNLSEEFNYSGLFVPEATLASGFWGKCKKFERDFYMIGDKSVEAIRFFNKEKLLSLELPGFDESQTGSEDWDLSDRFIAKFPNYHRTMSYLEHDEGHIILKDQIKKKKYQVNNGISSYLKVSPKYRRVPFPFRSSCIKQWYKFVLHPILTVGTIYMKIREGSVLLKSS